MDVGQMANAREAEGRFDLGVLEGRDDSGDERITNMKEERRQSLAGVCTGWIIMALNNRFHFREDRV